MRSAMDTVSGFSPGIAARDRLASVFLEKSPLLGGTKQTHEFEAAEKPASFSPESSIFNIDPCALAYQRSTGHPSALWHGGRQTEPGHGPCPAAINRP